MSLFYFLALSLQFLIVKTRLSVKNTLKIKIHSIPQYAGLIYLLGVGLSFSHLSEDVGQFFTLPLGTDVCAQTAFQEFQGTLILGNLQQFHGSLFIRSVTNNFTYQITHELGVAGLDLKIK